MLQSLQNDAGAALRSYRQAMAADNQFAPPYIESAVLEAASGQWAEVIQHTNKVISLAPDSFAGAYYLNAKANIRIGKEDAAKEERRRGAPRR